MTRDCVCPRARHEHGTEQAYISDTCRCRPCRGAHAQKAAWRRRQYAYGRDVAHLAPAVGSARRVQALAWLGWSFTAQAERLGWDPVVLHRILGQPRITSSKAAAIGWLYDELWNQLPPETSKGERISATVSRNRARRLGWSPPLAWDDDDLDNPTALAYDTPAGARVFDDVAVERIMAGSLPAPTISPERIEAIRRLSLLRLNDTQIGDRIGMTKAAVCQTRLRHGIPSTQTKGAA